jgi:hypothetical protein
MPCIGTVRAGQSARHARRCSDARKAGTLALDEAVATIKQKKLISRRRK